jgi:hypothetical protein
MPVAERRGHVRWALDLISRTPNCFEPVRDERRAEIEAAHNRLRGMLRRKPLEISAYEPDVLGCYVFVPVGARTR